MKWICIAIFYSCIFQAGPNGKNKTPFLLIPKDTLELKKEGYISKGGGRMFFLKTGDTLANIEVINLKAGLFRSDYYITNRKTDTTGLLFANIISKSDSILIQLNNAAVVRCKEYDFLIVYGYSYNKKMATIHLKNLKVKEDKIFTVNYLKDALQNDEKNDEIKRLLDYIDNNWEKYPGNNNSNNASPEEVKGIR